MQTILFLTLIFLFLSSVAAAHGNGDKTSVKPYCGCLIFIDDLKDKKDLDFVASFSPDFLLRSWYRWGEPTEDKLYSKRGEIVTLSGAQQIGIGGGTSLSVVNERDLNRKDFDKSWLSVNLDGSLVEKNDKKFGSLSVPGFRKYLISNLLNQVQLGVKELHLGESNGEIHFDDWTLGIKGDAGFIQWLRKKHSDKQDTWWNKTFGELGINIHRQRPVQRRHFLNLTKEQAENFRKEFGTPGSWNGNLSGLPTFLADLYKNNLEFFLIDLREGLKKTGSDNVVIDLWGFADWMPKMSVQPDAYLSTPPDERWKLNWSTDPQFNLEKNRARIKDTMEKQKNSVKPIPVVFIIDHPKPFDDFKKFTDARQAEITQFFASITQEIGANFVFRSYSTDRKDLGVKTTEVIRKQCSLRKQSFCPKNE